MRKVTGEIGKEPIERVAAPKLREESTVRVRALSLGTNLLMG